MELLHGYLKLRIAQTFFFVSVCNSSERQIQAVDEHRSVFSSSHSKQRKPDDIFCHNLNLKIAANKAEDLVSVIWKEETTCIL